MRHRVPLIANMADNEYISGFDDFFTEREVEEADAALDDQSKAVVPVAEKPKRKPRHVALAIMVNGRNDYILRYKCIDNALQAEFELADDYKSVGQEMITIGPDDFDASIVVNSSSIVGWSLVPVT